MASSSSSRLDEAVVSSRLWLPACAALAPPLPEAVPTAFASLAAYAAAFEPLLLEEAVEGVRSAFEDAERGRRGAPVTLDALHEEPNGWRRVAVKPANDEALARLHRLHADRDTNVVVLSRQVAVQPAAGGGSGKGKKKQQQQQQQQPQQRLVRVTGLAKRWELDSLGLLYVYVRPWCGVHEWQQGPCCEAYKLLAHSVENQQRAPVWQLTPAGSTITSVRELAALGRAQAIPILPYLLNPAAAAAAAPGPAAPAAAAAEPAAAVEADAAAGDTAAAGDAATASAPAAAPAAPAAAAEPEASALPPEVSSPAFWSFLQAQYDGPQIEAILRTAAHVVQPPPPPQQRRGAAAAADAAAGSSSSSTGSSAPPVTLIQGPPGTGKTYTVLGVLNLWHMVLYHRHYASLDAVVQRLVADRMPGTRIDAVLLAEDFQTHLAPRPRILVCAPSNAAIDELLERVMRGGFRDKEGRAYNPDVVRLGSEEALSAAAQEVWVEQLCGRLLASEPRAFAHEHAALQQKLASLEVAIRNLGETVLAMRGLVDDAEAAAAASPGDGARAAALAAATANLQGVVTSLVRHFEALRVARLDLERRSAVFELVVGARSRWWQRKLATMFGGGGGGQRGGGGPGRQQQQLQQQDQRGTPELPATLTPEQWRATFRAAPWDVQSRLELSFVDNAEMVFTTLSSSGRDVFGRLGAAFPLVLIDEAAQAAEVASLQPLVYGARGVVMVGDPQQLPATIFSQAGKQLALERSLFERLDTAGCPVTMLRVQYRMHPAIRAFPSAFFYKNALIDADSVLRRPPPWFSQQQPRSRRPSSSDGGGGGGGSNGGSLPLQPVAAAAQQQWPPLSPPPPPPPRRLVGTGAGVVGGSSSGGGAGPTGVASGSSGVVAPGAAGGSKKRGRSPEQHPPDAAAGGPQPQPQPPPLLPPLLLPYGVFDVADGREHTAGRSKANAAEARLAVEIYDSLRPALLAREAAAAAAAAARQASFLPPPPDVGIVTPYRAQRDLLRSSLVQRYGSGELARVKVETIDSFQGKQLDVVILSCVRAGGGGKGANRADAAPSSSAAAAAGVGAGRGAPPAGGQQPQQQQQLALNRRGVGFLSDVRRMNVAITRARLACLVLGHVATLVQDAAWAALVNDAAQRGCLFAAAGGQAQAGPAQHQQQHQRWQQPPQSDRLLRQQVQEATLRQEVMVAAAQQERQQLWSAGLGADGRPLRQQPQPQQPQQQPQPPLQQQQHQQEQQQWRAPGPGPPTGILAEPPAGAAPNSAAAADAYAGMSPEQAAAAWVLWPLMAQQRRATKLG